MHMGDLDIDLLRTFTAVAECRSFTHAAKRLDLTQSAVSAQIRRLENHLGHELFDRAKRRIGLTESAETLMDFAVRILQLHDEALAEMGRSSVAGTIRLGIPDDYASFFLPRALQKFRNRFPNIQLEICCQLSMDLIADLGKRRIDIALVTHQPCSPGGEVVCTEPLVWAQGAQSNMHGCRPLPLALYPPGFCTFRDQALKALHGAEIPWEIVCTSRSMAGIRAAVSAGLAMTVAATHALGNGLVAVSPDLGLPRIGQAQIALHLAPSDTKDHVQVLADFLREEMATISTIQPGPAPCASS
ncbi:LysR family transcriptional regulator [Desulfoplanes sp.]